MSTLYIYRLDDYCHVATLYGPTNDACEDAANTLYGADEYGWTYTPAFRSISAMFDENPRAQHIEV